MLHYLRPAVEKGNADANTMEKYAVGIFLMAVEYYGEKGAVLIPEHNPIPEALFWFEFCRDAMQ